MTTVRFKVEGHGKSFWPDLVSKKFNATRFQVQGQRSDKRLILLAERVLSLLCQSPFHTIKIDDQTQEPPSQHWKRRPFKSHHIMWALNALTLNASNYSAWKRILNHYTPKTFAVTPKYDNNQLWIHGRQVGFAAESGKTLACIDMNTTALHLIWQDT